MKTPFIVLALLLAVVAPLSWAQDRIYRCGNEYTNNASQAKERGCKLVEGGNVTVVEGTRPAAPSAPSAASTSSAPAGAPRVSAADQRARDADARAILEDELRKAQARLEDARKEYNDGSPQRTALELRNPQGYAERTAELKAKMERAQADVDGIRRELDRRK